MHFSLKRQIVAKWVLITTCPKSLKDGTWLKIDVYKISIKVVKKEFLKMNKEVVLSLLTIH